MIAAVVYGGGIGQSSSIYIHAKFLQLQINATLGEDDNQIVYLADCSGHYIGGKTLTVAVQSLKFGSNQMEIENFQEVSIVRQFFL